MKSFTSFLLPGLYILVLSSCYQMRGSKGGGQIADLPSRKTDPSSIALPNGFHIEAIASGLNFPTAVTFDENGALFVIESGYSYGEVWTEPKLLKVANDGSTTTIATGNRNGP